MRQATQNTQQNCTTQHKPQRQNTTTITRTTRTTTNPSPKLSHTQKSKKKKVRGNHTNTHTLTLTYSSTFLVASALRPLKESSKAQDEGSVSPTETAGALPTVDIGNLLDELPIMTSKAPGGGDNPVNRFGAAGRWGPTVPLRGNPSYP